MAIFRRLYDTFVGREKLSEQARIIGHIFDDEDTVGQPFFDTAMARFENFDQHNAATPSQSFSEDVRFIIQCVAESLSSSQDLQQFSDRIDSYMFMHRRIEEYVRIILEKNYWKSEFKDSVKDLKIKVMRRLSSVFAQSKGLQPNLFIKDKALLERMNIYDHLKSMTTIKEPDMNLFLALCKISLQSLSAIRGTTDLCWKEIVSNVQDFGFSLQEFVTRYIDCELAFREFRFDVSAFIELMRKLPMEKHRDESPFIILIRLRKNLDLNPEEFYAKFLPFFESKVKGKLYRSVHIADLLIALGRHSHYFSLYFSVYAANVENDTVWEMYLYLGRYCELSEDTQNYLITQLSDRVSRVPISSFRRYMALVDIVLKDPTLTSPLAFRNILGAVFNAFIGKQLLDDSYASRFSDFDLRDFFKIGLALSTTPQDGLQQTFAPLIIRRLLFQTTDRSSGVGEKLRSLFTKVNTFDRKLTEENDPQQIIKDEWLQELLLVVPQDFQGKLTRSIYQDLCDRHSNNHWTMYIWHRITDLSLIKSKPDNASEMLTNLNVWMETATHDTYQPGDTLTIIFIGNLFEAVIFKHINSILTLPKIDHIVDFIVHIRKDAVHPINPKHVDDFVDSAKKAIQNTMLLQGESVRLQYTRHPFHFSRSQMLDLR